MVRGGSDGRYVAMGIWAAVSCTVMHVCKHGSPTRAGLEAHGAGAVAVPEVATRRRNVGLGRDRSCATTPTPEDAWSASMFSVGSRDDS
jgi:hypothetical protein